MKILTLILSSFLIATASFAESLPGSNAVPKALNCKVEKHSGNKDRQGLVRPGIQYPDQVMSGAYSARDCKEACNLGAFIPSFDVLLGSMHYQVQVDSRGMSDSTDRELLLMDITYKLTDLSTGVKYQSKGSKKTAEFKIAWEEPSGLPDYSKAEYEIKINCNAD